jgi:glutamate N-acetyltransferase/amino-acid N-acetyltransferase
MKLGRRAHRVLVPGFRFAGVRAGLKTAGPDVALIVADAPAVAAGVFTTNKAAAAPVRITQARIASGRARAVLVHAGNANACTGALGRRTVEVSTARVARALGIRDAAVLACATGIGVPVLHDVLLPRHAALTRPSERFREAARSSRLTRSEDGRPPPRLAAAAPIAVVGKGEGSREHGDAPGLR